MAANRYENAEKVKELLDEKQLGQLQKRIFSTEKSLSEILRKLSALEADRAEKEALAREEAARAEAASAVSQPESPLPEPQKEVSEPAPAPEKEPESPAEAPAKAPVKAEKAEEPAKTAAEKPEKKAEEAAEKAAEKTAESAAPVSEEKKEEKSGPKKAPEEKKPREAKAPKEGEKAPGREEKAAESAKEPAKKPAAQTPAAQSPAAGAPARPASPAAPRAPRYFRNGQEQGVYVAKPGVDVNAGTNTGGYRPRAERPARPAGPRPAGGRPAGARPVAAAPVLPKEKSAPPKKKTYDKTYVEKKPVSKRTLVRQQGMTVEDFDENKSGYRKLRTPKKQKKQEIQAVKIDHAVVTTQEIPLKVLSEKLGISAVEISKRLFKEGIMKSINDSIDYDNAALLAADMGIDLEYKPEKTAEDMLRDTVVTEEDGANLVPRAPVVTVMGHVDHGKTSLLDKIRSTSVTAGEAGGITQSIGAYTVTAKGKQITFIDTPGHAAFTAMRARGAQVTDIVVLVVAADDGIMPQTVEAINHAKAANVPIIVAMNKMDKPEVNPDRVRQGLIEQNLVPEEWGGDTMIVPVSAKTGKGIDELLDAINLEAEMLELKANPDRPAKGTIIEAKLDKGKGPVASIIVQNGTLHTGDNILSGTTMGRVRAMFDDKGRAVKAAGPSMAVSVLGLEDVPNAGDSIVAVDQSLMKQVQEERKNKERESMIKEQARVTLDDVFAQVEEGKIKTLNLIVKGDVQGSVEAVKQSLEKLSNEEVRVKVIHAAAGAINESDVMLADSANAIIIGFNVRPDANARKLAESSKVDVRSYRIIYELIDDMEAALKGMLSPKTREVLTGKCEVRQTFNITGVGTVAGCYVTEGVIRRGGRLRIYREDIMICEGGVRQLKRFKDDVKEVAKGYECGCSIDGFNDIKVGDIIECYVTEEVKSA
ncbi:MAG TPA: translation initiation factor IF-2 [Candidatus Scatosoma pullicola]|nr:translation initiation factor IF-2 [Candidatus Scatosoma pullicola]